LWPGLLLGLPVCDPRAKQRGFSIARWGRYQGQFPLQTLIQQSEKARTRDDHRSGWGKIEFGGQDLDLHAMSLLKEQAFLFYYKRAAWF
jgi:hypothetical protein